MPDEWFLVFMNAITVFLSLGDSEDGFLMMS